MTPDSENPMPGLQAPERPMRFTLRRHRVLLLMVICLFSSAVFLLAPLMKRSYALRGSFTIKPRVFEPLPELATLPEAALRELAGKAPSVQVASSGEPAARTVTLSTTGPTRDAAYVQLHQFAEMLSERVRHRAEEAGSAYRSRLGKDEARLADAEDAASREIEAFRSGHPGILADDPTSIISQFDKLSTRLDEKQQRFRLVTDQISRLQEYKRTAQNKGVPPPPLPQPLPPAASDGGTAGAVNPDKDSEVLALTAQLQLINDQIEQQVTTEHRTEQHPYVVDLRNQQVTLQKRLEAAKDRAAAGRPAPAVARTPLAAAPSADPTLAAAQQVDLQIASLQAERDTLDADVKTLAAQHDQMETQVREVEPARRQLAQLNSQLESIRKGRQVLRTQLEEYDRRFPRTAPGAAAGTGDGEPQTNFVEISPLALASSSTLPRFPQVPLVYAAGLLLGFGIAYAVAILLHRTDHTLHSAQEAGAILEVPLLGTVSEIRTPAQRRRRRLWKSAGRPLVSAGLLVVMVGSAVICYRHIADPEFHGRGLSSAISLGDLHDFLSASVKEPMP